MKIKNNIHGILLLDKPRYITSNGALQRVKYLFNAKKAGHTGSLDPLATGMLPLCFGDATKLSQYLLESDKSYWVEAELGKKTETGDAEGNIIETKSIDHITLELIQQTLSQFVGKIAQIPPMYSALKHQGKPLYELARKGIEVERKPREVTIYQLELLSLSEDRTLCRLLVHCTKGTYIRTLVEDIGEILGCGAYVKGLRRMAVKPYLESSMVTLQEIEETSQKDGSHALLKYLLPLESAIKHLPIVKLSPSTEFYLRAGNPVMVPHAPVKGLVCLLSQHADFLGVGEVLDDGRVAPKRLLKKSVIQNRISHPL